MRFERFAFIVIGAAILCSGCSESSDSGSEAKSKVSDTINSVTESVKNGAQEVGDTVSDAASGTAEAVKEGAEKVGQGVSDAGEVIESNLESIKGNVDPASVPEMEAGQAAPAADTGVQVLESDEVAEVPVPDSAGTPPATVETAVDAVEAVKDGEPAAAAVVEQVSVEPGTPAPADALKEGAEAAGNAVPDVPSVPQ